MKTLILILLLVGALLAEQSINLTPPPPTQPLNARNAYRLLTGVKYFFRPATTIFPVGDRAGVMLRPEWEV